MDNFIQDLVGKLEELYNYYEMYMWRNTNAHLDILLQDNTICFFLYDSDNLLDEFILSFDVRERRLYNYLCLRLMILTLGNVFIHRKDNIIYNDKHKPYLEIIVNDEELLNTFNMVINIQEKEVINSNTDIIKNIYKLIPKKRYPSSFMDELGNRIEKSKRLIRGDFYE